LDEAFHLQEFFRWIRKTLPGRVNFYGETSGLFVIAWQMNKQRSFFSGLRSRLSGGHESVTPEPSQRLRLSGKGLRVPVQGFPFAVEMGKQTLHICPDLPVDRHLRETPHDFIVFDPELYYSGIAHSLRLMPGKKLAIDYREESQKLAFGHPRDAFRRHLQIMHEGNSLVFRDPISELGTYLSLLADEPEKSRLELRRQQNVKKIIDIFGGPIEQLQADVALDTLQQVNRLLKQDPYRRKDSFGNVGGLVELPGHLTPIVVGDLHAQLDNLLKILCENSFLDCLERGDAALILLGDAVHPEAEGELEFMDSSVLIMDLIFKLKLRFPEQVFFIVGNHDSFSPDVMKAGVPQSLLWEKKITELRGEEYREELGLYYRQSPLVVLSEDFLACHAGPARSNVSLDTLVEARQYPGLMHELTWNRVKTRGYPLGYTRRDVHRFRKSLNLEDTTPFIVAHYPQSRDGTLWLNVGQIPQHHVLFSARSDQLAVFTRVQGEMLPQIYPAESLLETINNKARAT
jgi:predicted phosphodiesterase